MASKHRHRQTQITGAGDWIAGVLFWGEEILCGVDVVLAVQNVIANRHCGIS